MCHAREAFASHEEIFYPFLRFLSSILGQPVVNVTPDMRSKDSRREWETAFSNSVVAPVLTVCGLYFIVII